MKRKKQLVISTQTIRLLTRRDQVGVRGGAGTGSGGTYNCTNFSDETCNPPPTEGCDFTNDCW